MIKWLREINTKDKRVILRADLSVPIKNGKILNDFQLRRSLPTLQKLKDEGAKTLIISHAESKGDTTLKIISEYLKNFIPVTYLENYSFDTIKEEYLKLSSGEFLLLDNIRKFPEEEKNDEIFAQTLAAFGGIYVNDAFAVNHRHHASIVSMPKFISSVGGYLLEDEMHKLSKAFTPEHPFVFILGGAKFETKLPLIEKFTTIADRVFVGGALANDFFKAENKEIGKSLCSEGKEDISHLLSSVVLPKDVVVKKVDGSTEIKKTDSVLPEETIVDCGPETLEEIAKSIQSASMVVWNGPFGFYEIGFVESSKRIAEEIATSNAYSILGGGDTLSVISDLHIEDKIDFISTGGGAMLEFLDKGTLPGLEALKIID